jgi:hypothetical protein
MLLSLLLQRLIQFLGSAAAQPQTPVLDRRDHLLIYTARLRQLTLPEPLRLAPLLKLRSVYPSHPLS